MLLDQRRSIPYKRIPGKRIPGKRIPYKRIPRQKVPNGANPHRAHGKETKMSKNPLLVCIGNSIVNGYPHRRSQCFVSLIREETDYDVINKGVNGDTAQGMLYRFQQDVISKKPDYMMLLTGSNDFISGLTSPRRCMDLVEEMCGMCRKSGITPILLTPILCDGERAMTEWVPADYVTAIKHLKTFSGLLKEYVEENDDCILIDLQEAYLDFDDFVDGIHPTAAGHRFIADYIKPLLP